MNYLTVWLGFRHIHQDNPSRPSTHSLPVVAVPIEGPATNQELSDFTRQKKKKKQEQRSERSFKFPELTMIIPKFCCKCAKSYKLCLLSPTGSCFWRWVSPQYNLIQASTKGVWLAATAELEDW